MTSRMKAKNKGWGNPLDDRKGTETDVSEQERLELHRNMIKNKTKTRKALPNDLSFLVVIQAPWDIELKAS